MSANSDIRTRQPSGRPTGGQYAEEAKAASGLTISPVAPVGIEPWELLEGIRGGADWDSEAVAIRDRWGHKEWEQWEDARADARVAGAHSAPIEFEGAQIHAWTSEIDGALVVQVDTAEVVAGRAVRITLNDGDVFDADPEAKDDQPQVTPVSADEHAREVNRVMTQYHQVRDQMERASAGMIATAVREHTPEAAYITLEDSDQGPYYWGTDLLDVSGSSVGDFDDVKSGGENLDLVLSNLHNPGEYPFINTTPGGVVRLDLDAASKWARGER